LPTYAEALSGGPANSTISHDRAGRGPNGVSSPSSTLQVRPTEWGNRVYEKQTSDPVCDFLGHFTASRLTYIIIQLAERVFEKLLNNKMDYDNPDTKFINFYAYLYHKKDAWVL